MFLLTFVSLAIVFLCLRYLLLRCLKLTIKLRQEFAVARGLGRHSNGSEPLILRVVRAIRYRK